MRIFLNVWWHIIGGWALALMYAVLGLFYCCTIILIPVGLGWLQFARFLLSPHTSAMVSKADLALMTGKEQGTAAKTYSLIIRILYFPFGLVAAIGAVGMTIGYCITIVGIPSGLVWARSLKTIFNPINKVRVPKAVGDEIERIKTNNTVQGYYGQQRTGQQNPAGGASVAPSAQGPQVSTVSSGEVAAGKSRDEVRGYSDSRLEEIVADPVMYNASLVEKCRHEMEVRKNAEALKEKVAGFDDSKLDDVIANSSLYSEELVYCCQMEYDRRDAIRQEQLAKEREEARIKAEKEAEEQRIINEQKKKERKARTIRLLKWVIPSAAVLVAILVVAYQFTDRHHFMAAMRQSVNGKTEKAISNIGKIGENSKYYEMAQGQLYDIYINGQWDRSLAAEALKEAVRKGDWGVPESYDKYASYLANGNMAPYIEKNQQKAADLYMKSPYSQYKKKGQKILDELEMQRKEAERQRLAEEKRKAAEKRAAELAAQRAERERLAEQKRVEQELAAAKRREEEAKKKAAYEKKRAAEEHEHRMRTDVAYRHKFGIFEVGDMYFGKVDARILSLDDTGQHGVLMVWGFRNGCGGVKSYAEAVEQAKKLGGRLATKEELTKYKRYIYHTQFWIAPGRVYCTDDSVRYQREMDAERGFYGFCMIKKF